MIRLSILAVMCMVLSACGDDPAPGEQNDAARDARGEVLGGTISDDMLPLDTVRSQSPPLVENQEGDDDTSAAAATEESAAAEPPPTDEPAPEVEPETPDSEAEEQSDPANS